MTDREPPGSQLGFDAMEHGDIIRLATQKGLPLSERGTGDIEQLQRRDIYPCFGKPLHPTDEHFMAQTYHEHCLAKECPGECNAGDFLERRVLKNRRPNFAQGRLGSYTNVKVWNRGDRHFWGNFFRVDKPGVRHLASDIWVKSLEWHFDLKLRLAAPDGG